MSDYWKSTPKYWCKHCSTYVRDTKFERNQHEATAKHQGNLKRFLRDLHRGHEREERESQRAKNEVDRLNKVVGGATRPESGPSPPVRKPAMPTSSAPQQLSVGERKRQIAQLADMGIAVPDEYKGEMAMAGDWKTLSERVISRNKEEELSDQKSDAVLNTGIRKRKYEGQEEEEEAGKIVAKRGWGSTTRSYPGFRDDDDDLDALLSGTKASNLANLTTKSTKKEEVEGKPLIKPEDSSGKVENDKPDIKKEESPDGIQPAPSNNLLEESESMPTVVFKKRKPKMTKER